MRRALPRIAALILAVSCRDRRAETARDLTLIPSPPPNGRSVQRPHSPDCVGLWPERVRVRGTLSREIHLGPPGYGETPNRDRKDSIVVLTLPDAVTICGDSTITGRSASVRTDRFQVTGHAREALDHIGQQVTVFGSLTPAVWGWHYLKIILEADSIPALRPAKQQPSVSTGSSRDGRIVAIRSTG
jgi:hypothetical protein